MAVPAFHALYAAGFFEAAFPSSSPLPWPSSGQTRLGSQLAPCGDNPFDAAGFASCCGPLACTLPRRARPRATPPRSPRTPAGYCEGDLVPPSTGLAPASHRELAGRDLTSDCSDISEPLLEAARSRLQHGFAPVTQPMTSGS